MVANVRFCPTGNGQIGKQIGKQLSFGKGGKPTAPSSDSHSSSSVVPARPRAISASDSKNKFIDGSAAKIQPGRFLKVGDVLRAEIDGLGAIENHVPYVAAASPWSTDGPPTWAQSSTPGSPRTPTALPESLATTRSRRRRAVADSRELHGP
jgi:hypothetical protein